MNARDVAEFLDISVRAVYERAGNRCEACGVKQYAVAYWTGDEWNVDEYSLMDCMTYQYARQVAAENTGEREFGPRWVVIVLTVAHLDHTPENCDPANLRAWCQRCHLRYDQKLHQANAAKTRKARKAVGDLFADEGGLVLPEAVAAECKPGGPPRSSVLVEGAIK